MTTSANAAPGAHVFSDRYLLALVVGALLVAGLGMAAMAAFFGGPYSGGWMMGGSWGGSWGWMGVVGAVVMFTIFLLLLALALSFLRRPEEASWAGAPVDPLGVARLRYARGEISREQYQQLVSDLTPKR